MSRVGKLPIKILDKVNVEIKDGFVKVSNEKDKLEIKMLPKVSVEIKDNQVILNIDSNDKQARSNWGTLRSLIANAVQGLDKAFEKTLMLKGVGYRMNKDGENLKFDLGFSHQIFYKKPENIEFDLDGKNKLTIRSYDKQQVGEVAAKIRSFRPVEPYKGKGFRYKDEIVRRKTGKKVASAE